jgi:N-acetyl-anhydromuramyl-L-alanine amidase AmpD
MRTVKARHYRKGRIAPVRLIVIHDMEAPESATTAENVARYFATTSTVASAHVNVDSDSAVRSVADADTAYAAPGANADGLQLEIAGYARQTREQWLDAFSRAALKQAAKVAAAWCKKYGIPAVRLTRAELRNGRKGITSHVDVSAVYRKSDHHDPGPNFPWDHFLAEVKNELGVAPPVVDAAVAPAWPGRYFVVRNPPMLGNDIKTWQRQMRQRGWDITISGAYSAQSAGVCRAFQQEKGLEVDGVVGPATWRAAWTEPVT